MKLDILFKTKGGHKEGMGDVVSSVSLAEEFRKNGHNILFFINDDKNVIDFVSRNFAFEITRGIPEIEEHIRRRHFHIAILNQLDTPLEEAGVFKRHTTMLVTVEDCGESARLADLKFNILYPIDDAITDPKFMPLADTYRVKHDIQKTIKEKVGFILVTQGGSDTYGFTPKIIKSLSKIPSDVAINIVIGPNFSHITELNEALTNSPRSFTIIKNKTDLSDIMLDADVAISAGGNTMFELCCLGVPTVIVCAEIFEVSTAKRLQEKRAIINLGYGAYIKEDDIYAVVSRLIDNVSLRQEMGLKSKNLIDGMGVKRIAQAIENVF